MLDYLVTRRARRELLRLLWLDGGIGSVSALARASGVSFAAAYQELEAMKAVGLALAERHGPALEYRANRAHPEAGTLVSLLAPRAAPVTGQTSGEHPTSAEDALIDDLVASHGSEAIALALPGVIWRQRDTLDYRRLRRDAIRRNERQTLGFYLQLTGRLSGDLRLVRTAWPLRDGRRTRRDRSSPTRRSASDRCLARRWGYLVNIELARFAAAFRR